MDELKDIRILAIENDVLCFQTSEVKVWADEAQIINGSLHLYKNDSVVASFDLSKFCPQRRE